MGIDNMVIIDNRVKFIGPCVDCYERNCFRVTNNHDMLQIELVHRALENERWQEAELRLLRLQQSEDHIGSAYAEQMLASLWAHLGLEQRATTLMQKLVGVTC